MALIDYLLKHEEARGVEKMVVMAQLRDYVERTNLMDLVKEIGAIWNEKHLNILVGAGMPSIAYHKVIAQKARLMGVA